MTPLDDQPVVQTAPNRSPAAAPQPTPQPQAAPVTAGTNQDTGEAFGAPQVEVNNPTEDFKSGALGKEIKPTDWEGFMNWTNQKLEGTTDALSRWANEKVQEKLDRDLGVTKISPEEAQKRFPGMPEPFTEPVDPNVAQLQYDHFKHEQRMQQWALHGTMNDENHPIAGFLMGVAGSMVDPVNVALGLATDGASVAAGISNSLRNVFLKNLVVGGALAGIDYGVNKSEHMAPSAEDAIYGTVVNTAALTLLHAGWGRLMDRIKKTMPEDLQQDAVRTGVGQHEAGAKVDTTPQMVEAKARAQGEIEGQQSPYRFQAVDHPSEVPHYAARTKEGKGIQFTHFDSGFHAVDDPFAANNMTDGKVAQIDIPKDSKFIDGEKPLPKELVDVAEQSLEEAGMGDSLSREELEKIPANELIQKISELSHEAGGGDNEAAKAIQDAGAKAGYAGIKYTNYDENGKPVHNGVVMFDEPKLAAAPLEANPEMTKKISEGQKEAFLDKSMKDAEAKKDYTPEIAQEIHDFRHGEALNSEPEYMDPIVQDAIDQKLKWLEAQAEEKPELKSDLEEFKKSLVGDAQEKGALENLADCIESSVT